MKKGIVINTADIETALLNKIMKSLIQHLEEIVIEMALIKTYGNTAAAARMCGINKLTAAKIRDRKRARR